MGSVAVAPEGGIHDLHPPQQQQQPVEGAGHPGGSTTEDADELPSLHSLLGQSGLPVHSTAEDNLRSKQRPPAADTNLGAALAGVLALSGSLVSYTIARFKSSRRERNLKQGLAAKEQALAATKKELGTTKKQLSVLKEAADRRCSLEAELAASRANLAAMTAELQAGRAASHKLKCDVSGFQDQLHSLSSTNKQQVTDATAAAEQRVAQADQERQEAEGRWQKAFKDLQAAQEELETVKGELGLRGSQLEGLTRELEFTRRQLVEAEKRVEQALVESRSARSGYAAEYNSWD